jgi:hypothetical protein
VSRKIQFYCAQCQLDGPTVNATPLGAAFGAEKNAKDWYEFIEKHLDRDHDIAIYEVT